MLCIRALTWISTVGGENEIIIVVHDSGKKDERDFRGR
jgi:hypothetical protein